MNYACAWPGQRPRHLLLRQDGPVDRNASSSVKPAIGRELALHKRPTKAYWTRAAPFREDRSKADRQQEIRLHARNSTRSASGNSGSSHRRSDMNRRFRTLGRLSTRMDAYLESQTKRQIS